MKKFENAKMLNEVEMNAVAGGGVVDKSIVNWLLDLFSNDGTDRPLPFPQDRRSRDLTDLPCDDPFYTKDAAPARPLPFPQDRRGNKAPLEAP